MTYRVARFPFDAWVTEALNGWLEDNDLDLVGTHVFNDITQQSGQVTFVAIAIDAQDDNESSNLPPGVSPVSEESDPAAYEQWVTSSGRANLPA